MATFQCRGLLAEAISLKIDRVISSCVASLGSHIPVFVAKIHGPWRQLRAVLSQEDLLGRRSYWILARDRTGLCHPVPWAACHASASSIMVKIICFDVVKWQSTGVCNGTVW